MALLFDWPLITCAACSFIVCAAILWILLRTGWAWSLATDVPNARSLHTRPTPRVGGWGIVPAIILAIVVWAPQFAWLAAGTAVLAAISQIDDRRGLSARVRFGAHAMVVIAMVLAYPAAAPWWQLAVLVVLLVWLINLYNFMDGMDGLAGGMTVLGFAAYALAAWSIDPVLARTAAAVSAAGVAFLLFNFSPARIFLGDAGSIALGFLAGAVGYWGWRTGSWPFWFPAMVFAPFIADASVTLLKRLLRGQKFWQAHREHYYQRMVRMGSSHAQVSLRWYLVMTVGIVIALAAVRQNQASHWAALVCWMVILCILGWRIDRRWLIFTRTEARTEVSD
ncbi:MAG: MraY family glycosyltransferase [Janthinobacterium lividum]